MALRALMLKKSIDTKRAELQALEEKDAGFATREAELEAAEGQYREGQAGRRIDGGDDRADDQPAGGETSVVHKRYHSDSGNHCRLS